MRRYHKDNELPRDLEFYEDANLLVYRPCGLLNEASVNKVIGLIGDLEAKLKDIRLAAMVTGCSASLPTD